jgi:hypothetical protein
MDKLERDNRKRFMDRVAGGEDARKVLVNADKLQRNRTAKQRLEDERKIREQKQQEQQQAEKARVTKLKRNTAQMFQSMSGLKRSNRVEFMARLDRGENPTQVLADAKKRDAAKGFSFAEKPSSQLIKMTPARRFNTPKPKLTNANVMRKRRENLEKQKQKRKEKQNSALKVQAKLRAGKGLTNAQIRNVVRRL